MSAKKKVEKKEPVEKKKDKEPVEPPKEKTPEEIEALLFSDLENYAHLIDNTAQTKEMRHMYRVLRHTFARLRRKLNTKLLKKFVQKFVPDSSNPGELLKWLSVDTSMDIDTNAKPEEIKSATKITPELEIYVRLLVSVYLIDNKHTNEALASVDSLIEKLGTYNRRTMDPLSAKAYFYYSRAYEQAGKLADIRSKLLQLQRTATLRHNYDGQVVLLNLLLRNYLHYNLYDQAEKLASKTEFKLDKASTNELARYHYYLGRVNAVQLSYSEAYRNLQQALRKGPRDTACGFRSLVTKFLIIVQLLLGEIPERSIFRSKGIRKSLKPYFHLTQTVRLGNVNQFRNCISNYEETFKKDKTIALIQRLHHNVIKTGLRRINSSYTRISFADICKKLNLENVQDAEFIVAKAISDGIIDAKINHTEGFIQSKDNIDIYTTNEPERAYHQRIEFCLQIHNDAVKAMRYPPDFKKKPEKQDQAVQDDNDDEPVEVIDDDDE